ncbi:DUF5710 domain-containing protein [Zoogloea sp.]|uniref:DUF5710 domain-containing protein n=1 Tax=Zoogloea sp. TaxID=49181 RepID=UPI001AC7FFDD|nr:DUF5710 domain-containing protein [Zoogloea sp.]MBN8283763.1 hypothetical protein [Zoogloea sp.]
MRTNLQVPFAEKDEAKRLGARWDATKRVWYVQNMTDPAVFKRWLPEHESPAPARAGVTAPKPASTASTVRTGSRFFEFPCDCLPWIGCAACRREVEARGWQGPA